MKYDLEKAQWKSSNRKCLMVIKSLIIESIRGAIPASETATKYLKKVESQFVGSSKAYAQILIQRLVNDKYTGGGIREHILKMSNMASKPRPMEMELPNAFIVHLVLASLPREFEAFVVNYNISPEKWDLEKLIAMCVQEEERLKASHGDTLNHVMHNKRKGFHDKNARPQGKPQWNRGSSSKPPVKDPKKDQ
ncbi:uncharacterized protein LOC120639855 [Panicum virgatum]|jgi:hypothetical protein|uniref:uncharacterized protein LOC120639855 n=1 Tax=Panicum virgatum TaxID=38727 RepID=UPI0019D59732|nr:uncharacterized protein LOC120639855 [Panicum virgatum]